MTHAILDRDYDSESLAVREYVTHTPNVCIYEREVVDLLEGKTALDSLDSYASLVTLDEPDGEHVKPLDSKAVAWFDMFEALWSNAQ